VARAARVLESAPNIAAKRRLLVARQDVRQAKAALRDLRALAVERHALLILVPQLTSLERRGYEHALHEAQVAIQAILGALSR
jgi:hypothetical protein